jgi:hypothetical protein
MTPKTTSEKKLATMRIIALVSLALMALPMSAMALDLTVIQDIVDQVVLLLPYFLDLIMAALPVIVILAVIAFVMGFLDKILGMLKGKL